MKSSSQLKLPILIWGQQFLPLIKKIMETWKEKKEEIQAFCEAPVKMKEEKPISDGPFQKCPISSRNPIFQSFPLSLRG